MSTHSSSSTFYRVPRLAAANGIGWSVVRKSVRGTPLEVANPDMSVFFRRITLSLVDRQP